MTRIMTKTFTGQSELRESGISVWGIFFLC